MSPCYFHWKGEVSGCGGVMLWRIVVLSIVAVTIAGCVTTRAGVDFASLSQKSGPTKPGQARIVVFREQAYGGLFDQGWDVKLDGQPMGDMKTGTYVYADRPAGRHQLSSEMVGFPGVTQRDITVTAGRTHFFVAKSSERAKTFHVTSAAGGLTGLVVGNCNDLRRQQSRTARLHSVGRGRGEAGDCRASAGGVTPRFRAATPAVCRTAGRSVPILLIGFTRAMGIAALSPTCVPARCASSPTR